jgi:type II secretory pathway pseudopilin PulG
MVEILVALSLLLAVTVALMRNAASSKQAAMTKAVQVAAESTIRVAIASYCSLKDSTRTPAGFQTALTALLATTDPCATLVAAKCLSAEAAKDPWGNQYKLKAVKGSTVKVAVSDGDEKISTEINMTDLMNAL